MVQLSCLIAHNSLIHMILEKYLIGAKSRYTCFSLQSNHANSRNIMYMQFGGLF